MNLNIPNSLFMHAHVLPGKYLEMYLKFNDCRHYIQAFIYNPLWYKLTMLRHPALLCSLHVRFESVQVSMYITIILVCLFILLFFCMQRSPRSSPLYGRGPLPLPPNSHGHAPSTQGGPHRGASYRIGAPEGELSKEHEVKCKEAEVLVGVPEGVLTDPQICIDDQWAI